MPPQNKQAKNGISLHPNTTRMTFRKLLRDELYFSSNLRRNKNIRTSQDSHRFRYPLHTAFLKSNKGKIKSFYDIGAANPLGAPTVIDAKQALGKNSKVVAVDIVNSSGAQRRAIRKARVLESLHAITRKPLAEPVDAIRFANVSQWMNQRDVMLSLKNIWLSLKPGGFLLGAISHGAGEHEFVLQKVAVSGENKTGFVEINFPIGFRGEREYSREKQQKYMAKARQAKLKLVLGEYR